MTKVTHLHVYSALDLDAGVVSRLEMDARELKSIPVDELSTLTLGNRSAYEIMRNVAEVLMHKMFEIENYMRVTQFLNDCNENGRL